MPIVANSKDTIKSKRQNSSEKHPFILYMSKNIKKVLHTFHVAFSNMPPETNNLDDRFVKSTIFNHAIIENLRYRNKRMFKEISNEHHDLLFDDSFKISLKTQQIIFQRFSKGIIRPPTKSRPIILKNCLGSGNKKIDNDGWDFLIAIQPQNCNENIKLSFGIINFKNIKQFIIPSSKNDRDDQIRIKINNIQWDYFYAKPEFFPEYGEKEIKSLDIQYLKYKKDLCNGLLNNNRIFLKKI